MKLTVVTSPSSVIFRIVGLVVAVGATWMDEEARGCRGCRDCRGCRGYRGYR